jgi:hypothetical protein
MFALGQSGLLQRSNKIVIRSIRRRATGAEMVRHYYIVEIEVPPGGLGRRIDDMHQFHHQRGIKDQRGPRRRDDEHDFIRWCFADLASAEAFAAQFGGEILQQKNRPYY